MEIFKDVKGYEGLYQVSDLGRVKSLARLDVLGRRVREKILKNAVNAKGYLIVNLAKSSKSNVKYIHQLVAVAFLGHEPKGCLLYTSPSPRD